MPGFIWENSIRASILIKGSGNGVYVFILSGDVSINDQKLNARDGYGIREIDNFKISADTNAEILLMEVPMN